MCFCVQCITKRADLTFHIAEFLRKCAASSVFIFKPDKELLTDLPSYGMETQFHFRILVMLIDKIIIIIKWLKVYRASMMNNDK